MGRAIDGVKGREWKERLRRYADSRLTVVISVFGTESLSLRFTCGESSWPVAS